MKVTKKNLKKRTNLDQCEHKTTFQVPNPNPNPSPKPNPKPNVNPWIKIKCQKKRNKLLYFCCLVINIVVVFIHQLETNYFVCKKEKKANFQ